MENSNSSNIAILILLLNSFTISLCLTNLMNSTTDEDALVSFKASIMSDPRAILSTSWSDNASICSWSGVSCSAKHHRVTALNLSGFGLAGTVAPHLGNLTFLRYLDISSNNFTGSLPSELSKLRRLEVLDVAVNLFTGAMPAWLGSFSQLEKLYLFNNSFSGRIPASLFNNSKLVRLSLSYNLLEGNIPKEIGSSSSLTAVRLRSNKLSGNIPKEIASISSLQILNLNNNQFSGSIPRGIFDGPSMREFRARNNKLSGLLPTDMCKIVANIKILSLNQNELEGQIPPSIWKCRHLELLGLSRNHFNGSIPHGIGNLSMLKDLRLGVNTFTGELPQEIGSLPILKYFSVYNNSLSGSLPHSIFNISSLKLLELSFNQFSGTLPLDFGYSLINLEKLMLSANKLSGPIPNSINNASKLTQFDIGENSFSGLIPNLGNLRYLEELRIWRNNLTGAESPAHELAFLSSLTNSPYLTRLEASENPLNGIIPASIANLSSSLEYFDASECNIMGSIPSEIGNLTNLIVIYLYINQLTGPIPPTIGKLKKLQRLYLSGNQLAGSIPHDLCAMSHLGIVSLTRNMLVGPLPDCLGDVKSLRIVYLGSNQLNSTIPPNLWTLTDLVSLNLSSNYFIGTLSSQLGKLKTVTLLDLSYNQFSGDIPTMIDACQSLEILNLSNNLLTGSIPKSLGNVRGLTALDLSSNSLSGSIPKSLEDLQFLQYFNVSSNRLEGEIPNGSRFGNFTAQSFSHNYDLCGFKRFEVDPCSRNDGGLRGNKVVRLIKYTVPSLLLLGIMAIVILVVLTRRGKHKKEAIPTDISPAMEWRKVTYIELERGTSCFSESNLLGRGGYGSVYEATLSDGLKVAVKVFNQQLQRSIRSFDTETEIMSAIRHRNLVRLIGCCSNKEFKALILNYMPNGSLDKWLYSDESSLDLIRRLNVAIDVAAALEYLHHGYTFPVVHCDVKPSNVLLDEDMVAHLADFGISKLFEGDEDFIQTQTLATIGYAAPEYGMEGKVSRNVDVYSFGIMLLEMLTGKKPTDDMFGGEMSIREWVSEALLHNAANEVVAAALLSKEDQHFSAKEQCVLSIFELAMKCLAISAHERVDMIEAAATLHKIKAATESRYAHSVSIVDH